MSQVNENTLDLTNETNPEYLIKDELLKENIKFKLNKSNIQLEDLLKIDELVLDTVTISGKQNNVYFEDIKLFPNLKRIEIRNNKITNENIKYFNDIDEIAFVNCQVDAIKELNSKNISLVGCEVNCSFELNDYVQDISIINTNCDSFDFLKQKDNLERLVIKNVKNFNMNKINFNMPIKYLSIEDVEKFEYDVLQKYSNLETVSIDYIGDNNAKECASKLKEMGYNVIFNDMYKA